MKKEENCFLCGKQGETLETLDGYTICPVCKSKLGLFTDETILKHIALYDTQKKHSYQQEICDRLTFIENDYAKKKIKLLHILRRLKHLKSAIFSAILITLFLTGCNRGISASQLAHINANLDDLAIVPEPITCFPKYKPWAGDPISGFGRGTGEGAVTGLDMLGHGGSGDGPFCVFAELLVLAGGSVS